MKQENHRTLHPILETQPTFSLQIVLITYYVPRTPRPWDQKPASEDTEMKEHRILPEGTPVHGGDAHIQWPASPTPEAQMGNLGKEEEATNTLSGNDCPKGIDF